MSNITFPQRRSKSRAAWIGFGLLIVGLLSVAGFTKFEKHEAAVRFSEQASTGKPVVTTVMAQASDPMAQLVLPGNTEAIVVADIYARATGYVRARYANIGDRVRAGQTLALIESPELDQDLARARATVEQSRAAWRQMQANVKRADQAVIESHARLEQAQANEALASATSHRWTRLVDKGVLPRQEGDEKQFAYSARKAEVAAGNAAIRTAEATVSAAQADVIAAEATIRANEANVARLEQLVAFERVTAPFDGIVTERSVELGDLVSAGGVDGGRKLFVVVQPNVLRVQVNVPQTFAPDLHEGQQAELTVRERPGVKYTGKVVRTAGALTASARTLLVEVQVDNKDGSLLPGMFSEVKFELPRGHIATLIPADALLANAQGTRVAMVDTQKRVHFRQVEVGRDLGTQIEVASGLEPSDVVVLNPGELLTEGQEVEIAIAGDVAK